ncbi:MAG: HAMP domain-containing histidine kinase [Campylobacteraceae bacterium]|nr:HAMP domain-containing histidine kinase [Campylobacteraceae bacterium]
MNSKRKNYIIVNLIVLVFTLILIISLNYLFLVNFKFSKELFIIMNFPILLLGIIVYLYLSDTLLEPLFQAEKNLQKTLKETLHELNIPASTIQINTQMLKKTIKDEKNLKRLNRITQATQDLLSLYEQMEYDIKRQLDKVDSQEFFLDLTIQNSIKKFQDLKSNINIKSEVGTIKIISDKNAFIKVIDNLISNAIKYNVKNGLIHITFSNNHLSIYNTGKSIDTKNIFIIFDEYYQEDSSSDGFGLGLNIVKDFCDKNKISIKINAEDKGTKIILDLSNIIH